MTKEEAIENLKLIRLNAVMTGAESFKEALDLAIVSLSKPSLPSNLDEAAEKIAWDIAPKYPDISWDNCFEKIKEGIKAGAEWNAGQFRKIEGELVDWYSTSEGKDYCCGIKTIDSFEVPEGFYIRKKQ